MATIGVSTVLVVELELDVDGGVVVDVVDVDEVGGGGAT